jgi:hypothetical protein
MMGKSKTNITFTRLCFILSLFSFIANLHCHAFQARASPFVGKEILSQPARTSLFASSSEEKQNNLLESFDTEATEDEGVSMDQLDWKKIGQQSKLFWNMAYPYFEESNAGRWLFAGMIGLTLLNSGVSVAFVSFQCCHLHAD